MNHWGIKSTCNVEMGRTWPRIKLEGGILTCPSGILPATAPPNIGKREGRLSVHRWSIFYRYGLGVHRWSQWIRPQSRQSARLFLQSSELGPPPHPFTHRRGDRQCGTVGIHVLCGLDVPLRWSLMCSRVAAMSISLDPLVMRFRTMSMSMYVPDRPTPSLRYTKCRYFYTASSNFCENLYFREHSIAELDAGFFKIFVSHSISAKILAKRRFFAQMFTL